MNLATLAKCRCICKQRDKLLMLLAVFLCTVAAAENDMTASTDKFYEFHNIPKELIPKGNVIDRIDWSDKAGRHTVLISHFTKGVKLEPGYVAQINAIQIDMNNNTYDESWKLKDFDYFDADIEYIANSLEVADIDRDSIFEVSFLYRIFNLENIKRKFMLYRNTKKYAIREYGTVGSEWTNGDTIPKVDSLVIDSAFKQIGNEYMQYAINRWNTFFEDGKDGIKGKEPPPKKD